MARRLVANVHVGDRFFAAGSTPPKEYADQITNPKAWGKGDAASSEDTTAAVEESGDKPYSEQTVKQLKAEIDSRNEDRDPEGDDYIVPDKPGNKPELVAALEADDEAADDSE